METEIITGIYWDEARYTESKNEMSSSQSEIKRRRIFSTQRAPGNRGSFFVASSTWSIHALRPYPLRGG